MTWPSSEMEKLWSRRIIFHGLLCFGIYQREKIIVSHYQAKYLQLAPTLRVSFLRNVSRIRIILAITFYAMQPLANLLANHLQQETRLPLLNIAPMADFLLSQVVTQPPCGIHQWICS